MAIQLYDLAGAEIERRFSPFCWRTKMALAHKGLDFETIPWRLTEKEVIGFSGQGKVPVLIDGDKTIADSWAIACHLEDAYPDRPSLFGGAGGRTQVVFFQNWVERTAQPVLARLIMLDIHAHLDPRDKDYFRSRWERLMRSTLEEFCSDPETRLKQFREVLIPLRMTLAHQNFLGGDAPLYADYVVFGIFQWARATSPVQLLKPDDPIYLWRERLLDAFDGIARQTLAYPV